MTGDTSSEAKNAAILLRATQLSFRTNSRIVWSGLEVDLHAGERLAIAGPSGSGKTLLLRTLAALEPLASGDISFAGQPLSAWFMPEYRARVVYVPQKPALHEGTVRDAIESPFRLRVHRGERLAIADVLRHLVTLGRSDGLLAARTEHLSGGELQIVSLLRALAIEPQILLLDEPTASLDVDATRSVELLVTEWLASDPGRATVWTSHNAEQLSRMSDRTISIGTPCET